MKDKPGKFLRVVCSQSHLDSTKLFLPKLVCLFLAFHFLLKTVHSDASSCIKPVTASFDKFFFHNNPKQFPDEFHHKISIKNYHSSYGLHTICILNSLIIRFTLFSTKNLEQTTQFLYIMEKTHSFTNE